jgi:hypothetical protein
MSILRGNDTYIRVESESEREAYVYLNRRLRKRMIDGRSTEVCCAVQK